MKNLIEKVKANIAENRRIEQKLRVKINEHLSKSLLEQIKFSLSFGPTCFCIFFYLANKTVALSLKELEEVLSNPNLKEMEFEEFETLVEAIYNKYKYEK